MELPDYLFAVLPHSEQPFPAEIRSFSGSSQLCEFIVLEPGPYFVEFILHRKPFPAAQTVFHIRFQPPEHIRVFFRKGIQDSVHGFVYQRRLVQFYLVVGSLTDFAGEGLQGPLEELVDGAHRKCAVVVQDVR